MSANPISRRVFLATAAGVTGSGIAGCAKGATQSSPSNDPVNSSDGNGDFGSGDFGKGDFGGDGGFGGDRRGSGSGLNSEINVIKSQLTLPEPFHVALPIPTQLVPRKTTDTDCYDLVQSVSKQEIIPGYKTTIWGYNGTFPGPTIVSTSGRQTVVNHTNKLPVPTVVHLHGGRTLADQDGYATDYLLPTGTKTPPVINAMPGMPSVTDPDAKITHGSRDFTYPMHQRAAPLWYHDHRMAFTGASIFKGLLGAIAGFTIFLGLPLGRLRHPALRVRAVLNAVAIGILVFLLFDVLGHANEPVKDALTAATAGRGFWWRFAGLAAVFAAGVGSGLIGLVYYDRWIIRRTESGPSESDTAKSAELAGSRLAAWSPARRLALLIAVGIGLHNFSEGLAFGQSANKGVVSLALLLVIGFGLHNTTEGFGIVGPLAAETSSRRGLPRGDGSRRWRTHLRWHPHRPVVHQRHRLPGFPGPRRRFHPLRDRPAVARRCPPGFAELVMWRSKPAASPPPPTTHPCASALATWPLSP